MITKFKLFENIDRSILDPYGEEDWDINYKEKENFIKLLKDNDAYDKFVRNIDGDIDDYLDGIFNYHLYLNKAFDWPSTPEGRIFWYKINKLWNLQHFPEFGRLGTS